MSQHGGRQIEFVVGRLPMSSEPSKPLAPKLFRSTSAAAALKIARTMTEFLVVDTKRRMALHQWVSLSFLEPAALLAISASLETLLKLSFSPCSSSPVHLRLRPLPMLIQQRPMKAEFPRLAVGAA
jgi:hypothetical protein